MIGSDLVGVLIEGAVALAWFGLTAAAYRKWGSWGLLGIPIGLVIVIALWVSAMGAACARGAGCV